MSLPNPAAREESSEINLAPMLDIVFIMLIFFVVTASFIKDVGVEVTLPPGLTLPPPEFESIVVTVESGGIFIVNGRIISRDSLVPYVRALHSENPQAEFAVLVTKSSKVGDTVAAVDAGRQVGWDVVPISMDD